MVLPLIIFLFRGHQTPTKQYNNFLDHVRKRTPNAPVYVIDPNQPPPVSVLDNYSLRIAAHSLGLLEALLYCQRYALWPSIIVSMDGSYVDAKLVEDRTLSTSPEIRVVYSAYLDAGCPKQPLSLFRFEGQREATELTQDAPHYDTMYLYDNKTAGHYPYNFPFIRDKMITQLIADDL